MGNKNILVTGCAGYIGASFAFEALKRGFNVIGIDNFSNSTLKPIKSIQRYFGEKFIFHECDLLNEKLAKVFGKSEEIDCVFHFAALKSVPESEEFPEIYKKNNIEGTQNLLNIMNDYSVRKMVFSSSAAVYGKQTQQPISESAELKPQNIYAQTKKISEEIIDEQANKGMLKAISLRYFNPLGSHEEKIISENIENLSGNIMAMILRNLLLKSNRLSIFGSDYPTKDGTGERDYIHIIDVVDAHFKAYESINKKTVHEIYNLGTGQSISVLELIKIFEHVNNKKINYEFAPRRVGDLAKCFANPDKANKELNWKARYNLEKMCADSYQAFRDGIK